MEDHIGETYGRWRVIGFAGRFPTKSYWDVKCNDCGHERAVEGWQMRNRNVRCSPCERERLSKRACKCGNPELAVRSWHDAEKTRPKAFRTSCKSCYNKLRQEQMAAFDAKQAEDEGKDPCDLERVPMLDSGPIARWLVPYFNTYTYKELQVITGVDDTIFGRLKDGKVSKAQVDTVDRILCSLEVPGELRELYPHLYEFTSEQMREAELWAME